MNLKELLLLEHSKQNMLIVAEQVNSNHGLFGELIQILKSGSTRETQHAAWAMTHILEASPQLGTAFLPELIQLLDKPKHDAVLRAVTRYLQTSELPTELHDDIWDYCSKLLVSAKTAIAVKVFAMTTLLRIVELWPELSRELRFMIEEQIPFGSAGFRNRGKKILTQLDKLGN